MKSTFRWLGLVAMPLRLIVGGICIAIFIFPSIGKWSGWHITDKAILVILSLSGIFLLLGLFTRFSASIVLLLAILQLLLPDLFMAKINPEWSLWALLMASSFVIFITGGGTFSLDHTIARGNKVYAKNWFRQIAGGDIPLPPQHLKILTILISIFFMGIFAYKTIPVKRPDKNNGEMKVLQADSFNIQENSFSFHLNYSNSLNGQDTIHLVFIKLFTENNEPVGLWNNLNFQIIQPEQILNFKNKEITAGPHSLKVATGSKCKLTFYSPDLRYYSTGPFQLQLADVSGRIWIYDFQLNSTQ